MNNLLSNTTHQLYTGLLKPIFFTRNPETVHNALVGFGVALGGNRLVKALMSNVWSYQHPSLSKTFDGITFPNPVGLGAGFDYNGDLVATLPAMGFGFHTIGTVTLESYEGNPPPRLVRFPNSQSLLVNKGLKNLGAKAIIRKLKDTEVAIPLGISIASTNKDFPNQKAQITDIVECFKLFEASSLRHSYYELNISCPNTFGGEPFTTPSRLTKLIAKMDTLKLSRPLYVKMPIDLSFNETLDLLQILDAHQVQGVIFGNLTKDKRNPAVHPDDVKRWKTLRGNLSGKPTWKRSNARIRLTRKHFGDRFTIIGLGGIFNGSDAKKKMAAGADLVQLITGMIYEGPQLVGAINRHLVQ